MSAETRVIAWDFVGETPSISNNPAIRMGSRGIFMSSSSMGEVLTSRIPQHGGDGGFDHSPGFQKHRLPARPRDELHADRQTPYESDRQRQRRNSGQVEGRRQP